MSNFSSEHWAIIQKKLLYNNTPLTPALTTKNIFFQVNSPKRKLYTKDFVGIGNLLKKYIPFTTP